MLNFSPDTSQLSPFLTLINQIFDLQRKVERMEQARSLHRNLRRMSEALAEMGFTWHDPTGEPYDETRTDCEASIAGTATHNLRITETLKPIVRLTHTGHPQLIQRAVVVVTGG
jgi:hypothetical protein